MHFYVLSISHELVFDEKFWIPEARAILFRVPLYWTSYPHLSELFMAAGIWLFGDNSWGWRIPSVLFGAMCVVLVYLISLHLAGKRVAMLSSTLYVFENLAFSMSGLAMLDVPATAFVLLSFWLYLKKRYALAGISLAVGSVCSSKVVLGVIAILAHWLLVRRKDGLRSVLPFAVAGVVAFFVLMPATDFAATGQWLDPFKRSLDMLIWQGGKAVSVTSGAGVHSTAPWEWLARPGGQVSWGDPDWGDTQKIRHVLYLTPTIWLLVVPSMGHLLYRYFSTRKNRNTPRFILLWFGATYLPWILVELITNRVMYNYYMLPTVGAISIAVAFCLERAWPRSLKTGHRIVGWATRAAIIAYLLFHFLFFLLLSPLTAEVISTSL
jgi:predicted membrane-bound dolichyl-phosphate-mannose-protein mannosyltransferase